MYLQCISEELIYTNLDSGLPAIKQPQTLLLRPNGFETWYSLCFLFFILYYCAEPVDVERKTYIIIVILGLAVRCSVWNSNLLKKMALMIF